MIIDRGTLTQAIPGWARQKMKLKAKFSNLTDTDLNFAAGKKEEMLTKVQTKLGKSKEELSAIIAAL